MNFLSGYIKGVLIGAGAILPGISSGVLLVLFGMYDKLVDSVIHFFDDFRENLKFLFPIAVGVCCGVVLFGNLLMYFFTYFPIPTKSCFIGLILGSLPILFKQANNKRGFHLHYFFYLILSLAFSLFLLFLENTLSTNHFLVDSNFFFLTLCGFFMAIGVVVPGVSSSVILMLFQVYNTYLEAISTLNMTVLFPMGIGLVIGGLVFLKIIDFLLKKHFTPTYYLIIGFVLGSTFILFPGFTFDLTGLISLILFLFSFFLAYYFEKEKI